MDIINRVGRKWYKVILAIKVQMSHYSMLVILAITVQMSHYSMLVVCLHTVNVFCVIDDPQQCVAIGIAKII